MTAFLILAGFVFLIVIGITLSKIADGIDQLNDTVKRQAADLKNQLKLIDIAIGDINPATWAAAAEEENEKHMQPVLEEEK